MNGTVKIPYQIHSHQKYSGKGKNYSELYRKYVVINPNGVNAFTSLTYSDYLLTSSRFVNESTIK